MGDRLLVRSRRDEHNQRSQDKLRPEPACVLMDNVLGLYSVLDSVRDILENDEEVSTSFTLLHTDYYIVYTEELNRQIPLMFGDNRERSLWPKVH